MTEKYRAVKAELDEVNAQLDSLWVWVGLGYWYSMMTGFHVLALVAFIYFHFICRILEFPIVISVKLRITRCLIVTRELSDLVSTKESPPEYVERRPFRSFHARFWSLPIFIPRKVALANRASWARLLHNVNSFTPHQKNQDYGWRRSLAGTRSKSGRWRWRCWWKCSQWVFNTVLTNLAISGSEGCYTVPHTSLPIDDQARWGGGEECPEDSIRMRIRVITSKNNIKSERYDGYHSVWHCMNPSNRPLIR